MRVLGFNKRAENAEFIEEQLRQAGYEARSVAITDDPEGDAIVIRELRDGPWDGISIGAFINGQHSELAATEQTTAWFTRVLNLIGEHAPGTRIILIRKPSDAVATIGRVLGR